MFYGGSRRKDAITEIDVESTPPVRSLTLTDNGLALGQRPSSYSPCWRITQFPEFLLSCQMSYPSSKKC